MKQKLLLASRVGLVIQKFLFIFDKHPKELKIVCIPTAANAYADDEKPWLEEEKRPFRDMGFNLVELDIADKGKEEVANALKGADVIYVTGGNTYYLLEKMKKCQFEGTIKDCLAKGAVYIGGSAGAIVTCPSIDFIRDMDDPGKAKLSDFTGLGLIEFKILPHMDHPKYGPIARQIALDMQSSEPVLGLRDDQAVFIRDSYIEVY